MSAVELRRQQLEIVKKRLAEEGAPPDLDLVIKPLLKKARQVHVAYICDHNYGKCEVWQKLMLMLCATKSNAINKNADWQAFASHLGLETTKIKAMENIQLGLEDPVTNTLVAFMQNEDASLDKIIEALQAMERQDILEQISGPLTELCEKVIQENNTDVSMITSDSGFSEESSVIIKPRFVVPVPCLLRNKDELRFDMIYSIFKEGVQNLLPQVTSKQIIDRDIREHNMMVEAPDEGYGNDASPPVNVGKSLAGTRSANFDTTVLLTFVGDGQETAHEVARILRNTTNSRGEHVGVVILEENERFVNADAVEFVYGVFNQVDYVVPILTPNYAATVKPNSQVDVSGNLDAEHARYIYKMMEDYYMSTGCMNYKIRSIVPNGMDNASIQYLTRNPIFKARKYFRDCEKFADLICRRKS